MRHEAKLTSLQPKYVEFTKTKGVLRCLRPDEDGSKAKGLIFLCPACMNDKEKKHFLVLLFDMPGVPAVARPHGRFLPTFVECAGKMVPSGFRSVTVVSSDGLRSSHILAPQDVCGWQGTLTDGMVSWST